MKKSSPSPYTHLLLLVASAGLFTACTGDALSDIHALPAGKYPITLSATVEGMTTRATVDGIWQGGETIEGVIFYDDFTRDCYGTVESNGTIQLTDKSGNPSYWQSTDEKFHIALYYPVGFVGVKADQSRLTDYLASDYMHAIDSISFGKPSSAVFRHAMAKVVVALIPGEGFTDVKGATVTFLNQLGTVSGSEVIPYQNATALLTPQQMRGKSFIRISIGGDNYNYTPSTTTEANLMEGETYLYNVTVNKTGLTVITYSGHPLEWQPGGSEDVTSDPL